MLKNYLKVALRSLWRQKGYSFINIFGLSIGLTSAFLILLWINDELNYDRFHKKEDQIYKAWNRSFHDGALRCWDVTPAPLGPALKSEFPEIQEMSRKSWPGARLLQVGEKSLMIKGCHVDPGFITIFSFPLIQGDKKTALDDPYSIILTESLARRLFGDEDPMNKIIRYNDADNLKVTGVMRDHPSNTDFTFEYLITWEYKVKLGEEYSYWGNNSYHTYVELTKNATLRDVNNKIRDITIRNSEGDEDTEVFLHSIKNWRLYSEFTNGKISGGRIEYVRLFGIIAGLILLIACINFMNLATARSEKRAKEVGIRKTIGAKRGSLISQFIGESILVSSIALVFGVIFTELSLPFFNELTNKMLYIHYGQLNYWFIGIGFVLFTGFLAGSYPAFYLSSFKPVKVLKGSFRSGRNVLNPRRVLVVLQFTFSISLIISTIIVYQQIQHAKNRVQGYNKNGLVYHFFTGDIEKNFEKIKQELLDQRVTSSVCKSNHPITQANSNTWGVDWKGKDPDNKIIFDQMTGSDDFAKTMGIEMVAGRDLNVSQFKTDSFACIINETAARAMRMDEPVGQIIEYDGEEFRIVGVFKDFIWGSPYSKIRPLFVRGQDWFNVITLRLSNERSISENMKKAEAIFKKYNANFPFNPRFVDEDYARKFRNEQLVGQLSVIFTILTIIISCLGLFGLAAYTAELRTKEIGIRKVLGARITGIVMLISKDFLRLVLIAFVIASVITGYLMQQWLEGYIYRIEISWWIFAMAGSLAALIAVLTVSYQAIRAGYINPVEALRNE